MPSLLILIPLAGIIILNLFFNNTMRRAAFWFAAVLFSIQLIVAVFHSHFVYETGTDRFSSFFNAGLHVDALTFVMLICIIIACFSSLIVSRYTLTDRNQRFNFVNLLLISSIGMNGIVMVRDIFSLYVFLEITAVSSFILIAFRRGKPALEGAFKYIILSAIATILMLSAIALFVFAAGDTYFLSIRTALAEHGNNGILIFATAIFLTGLFIKAGIVPFHGWLPDAYAAAPAPVSVLLAGIVTKACGVYTLIRLVTAVFSPFQQVGNILLIFGAASILVGALAAMGQNEMKRMLAYSSISQVGYIILGLGCGSELGLIGAVLHLFNHTIFKTLLFINAAALSHSARTTDMDKLGGLSYKLPVTSASSMAAFLSASGVPALCRVLVKAYHSDSPLEDSAQWIRGICRSCQRSYARLSPYNAEKDILRQAEGRP